MTLWAEPGTDPEKKEAALNKWYRSELKKIVPDIIKKWEKKTGLEVNHFGIKRMKTNGVVVTHQKSVFG